MPQRMQQLGVSGAMPLHEIFESEIDSGAFWDAFPTWQGMHTNPGIAAAHYTHCTHTSKHPDVEQLIELHPNLVLTKLLPNTTMQNFQACEHPDETVAAACLGFAAAVLRLITFWTPHAYIYARVGTTLHRRVHIHICSTCLEMFP